MSWHFSRRPVNARAAGCDVARLLKNWYRAIVFCRVRDLGCTIRSSLIHKPSWFCQVRFSTKVRRSTYTLCILLLERTLTQLSRCFDRHMLPRVWFPSPLTPSLVDPSVRPCPTWTRIMPRSVLGLCPSRVLGLRPLCPSRVLGLRPSWVFGVRP
jgi:hypothetical protein